VSGRNLPVNNWQEGGKTSYKIPDTTKAILSIYVFERAGTIQYRISTITIKPEEGSLQCCNIFPVLHDTIEERVNVHQSSLK
jgi:hypothetical protein